MTSDYLYDFLKIFGGQISILYVETQVYLKNELLVNTKNICKKTSYAFVEVTKNYNQLLRLYVQIKDKIPDYSKLASFDKNQIFKRFRISTNIKNPKLNEDQLAL